MVGCLPCPATQVQTWTAVLDGGQAPVDALDLWRSPLCSGSASCLAEAWVEVRVAGGREADSVRVCKWSQIDAVPVSPVLEAYTVCPLIHATCPSVSQMALSVLLTGEMSSSSLPHARQPVVNSASPRLGIPNFDAVQASLLPPVDDSRENLDGVCQRTGETGCPPRSPRDPLFRTTLCHEWEPQTTALPHRDKASSGCHSLETKRRLACPLLSRRRGSGSTCRDRKSVGGEQRLAGGQTRGNLFFLGSQFFSASTSVSPPSCPARSGLGAALIKR